MKIKIIRQFMCSLVLVLAMSCSSESKLFERKIPNGKIKATQGKFSGIDYLTIKKNVDRNTVYKLIYDCGCTDNRMSLTKYDKENQPWYAVTDSSRNFSFFGELLQDEILIKPVVFEIISREEMSLLTEAISKSGLSCCSGSNKPIDKVIGFVKRIPINPSW